MFLSLQDLQFDTKYGYLSRLTPNDANGGQGQDDRQTCPIGMDSLFIVNNYSKFEINIFSKDRDIIKLIYSAKTEIL